MYTTSVERIGIRLTELSNTPSSAPRLFRDQITWMYKIILLTNFVCVLKIKFSKIFENTRYSNRKKTLNCTKLGEKIERNNDVFKNYRGVKEKIVAVFDLMTACSR